MVTAMGEFGRTPKINPAGGRDHHPGVWTILMGGGPIKGGQVVGESDELGYAPKTRPVTPGEVAATILPGPGPRPAPGTARPAEPADPAGRLQRAADQGAVLTARRLHLGPRVMLPLRICLVLSIGPLVGYPGLAADLKLYPADIPLTGPRTAQQLLLVDEEGGRTVADRTAGAKFTSANPKIAVVDETGLVTPVDDGETTVTATANGKTATAKVRVTKAKDPAPPTFRNDVLPILTRAGCNSGACHGALAGKGGMKLTLRGYDPEPDHFVLTRQALARARRPLGAGQEPDAAQAHAGPCPTAAGRGSTRARGSTTCSSTGSPAGPPAPSASDADAGSHRGPAASTPS